MVLVGTCGYSYRDWVGSVYRDIRYALSAYTRLFRLVEIDSTFYSMPSKQMVESWSRRFPTGFHVTMKVPRTVTHDKRLMINMNVMDDINRFIDLVRPLMGKELLKALLIQLPPSLRFDEDRLESFISILPMSGGTSWAIEFRHISWIRNETFRLLEKYNISYVVVDEPGMPFMARKTADLSYVRFHGHGKNIWYDYLYSVEELRNKLPQLMELGAYGELYILFNNHPGGRAVLNALQLSQLLGIELTPMALEVMRRLERSLVK
ncbi:MAG: DUF72 domain-containing protein [Thermocladium sp.]